MFTTHGHHITGTRLGDFNPPLSPPRCDGLRGCHDCMTEASAVNGKLDYSLREENHDDDTLSRVYQYLGEAGAHPDLARRAIRIMQINGILFREREIH